MSSFNRIVLPVLAVLSLAFLAACGSSSHHVTPPPTGSFSNSSLSGTYVFSIVGSDDVVGNFQTITGSFSADGSGNIKSGGAVDFNNEAGESPNAAVTGGSYKVTSDGRGQATLNTTNPIGGSTLTLDFALSTSSQGVITQFDGNGTGSGSLVIQSAASQPAAANYVMVMSGINGSGGSPGAIAGAIAVDGSGNLTGTFDYNQDENSATCTLASGSTITVGGTPGTATLVTNCSTFNFDVYPVSANDYKLIETDPFPNFSGDLFLQSSPTLQSGQYVFTMAGVDAATPGPLALGGLMAVDASGNTITNGEEDFNDAGTSNISSSTSPPQGFSVAITQPPSGSSRYVVSFTNFVNGNAVAVGAYTFAAYPYGNSVALIEIDDSGVTAGTAFAQSSTALASGQGYAMNLSGSNANAGAEEDDIAEFSTTNTGFSGAIDMNDQAPNPVFDGDFTGSYGGIDATATGRGLITSNTPNANDPNIDAVYYTVSNTQTIMVQIDGYQVALGTLLEQNASGSASDFATRHLLTVRAAQKAMKARKANEKK